MNRTWDFKHYPIYGKRIDLTIIDALEFAIFVILCVVFFIFLLADQDHYGNEKIWGKFQRDCTPTKRKTE